MFKNDPIYQSLCSVRNRIKLLSDPAFVRLAAIELASVSDEELENKLLELADSFAERFKKVEQIANQRIEFERQQEKVLKSYFPGVDV